MVLLACSCTCLPEARKSPYKKASTIVTTDFRIALLKWLHNKICNVKSADKYSPKNKTLESPASNLKKMDTQQNSLLFFKKHLLLPKNKSGGEVLKYIEVGWCGGIGGSGAVVVSSGVERGQK